VLVVVAVNMSEMGRFRALLRGPWGDRIVLLLTFGLTVAVDLVLAIEVGVVLAAVLFMHRMTGVVAISSGEAGGLIEEDVDDFAIPRSETACKPLELPRHVETACARCR
jgi:SulP family sulfate permease